MKIKKLRSTIVFIVISALFVINAVAQPSGDFRGNRAGEKLACLNIPDLTEEQEENINALRIDHLKESTQHRAQMDELRAKKRSLMIEDSPVTDEIDNVIDQMTELRNKQLKNSVEHRQSIRELLTEEQRVFYDNRPKMRQDRRAGMREGRAGKAGRRGSTGRGMNRR